MTSLNISKCKEMIVPRASLTYPVQFSSNFVSVDFIRILGVTFTSRLTWKLHISEILKKASRRLYIIRCLRETLGKHELIVVFHAIITALFMYASPVFGHLSKTLTEKVDRFFRRSHRLICGRECECGKFDLFSDMLVRNGLNFLSNCETNSCHPLHHFVPSRLRISNHFLIPFSRTARRANSFFPLDLCGSK